MKYLSVQISGLSPISPEDYGDSTPEELEKTLQEVKENTTELMLENMSEGSVVVVTVKIEEREA